MTKQVGSARLAAVGDGTHIPAQSTRNLARLAYEKIENLIVNCELRPGTRLSIHDLQIAVGLSRMPVHQAVNRLADDTLIIVLPRYGLKIAPIDLTRERTLLHLRADLERFVVQLAAERSSSTHRNQLLHLSRLLSERRQDMTIEDFNVFDRRIDELILSAAGEPFLQHTLRPLHTIFRRIGWIYHNRLNAPMPLDKTIDCHLAVLDAVANRHEQQAIESTNQLIDFVNTMFDVIEQSIDPTWLDASIQPIL